MTLAQNLGFTADVIGSNKVPYLLSGATEETGMDYAFTEAGKGKTTYYNLNGQQMLQPRGICIERTTYDDGHVVIRKLKK